MHPFNEVGLREAASRGATGVVSALLLIITSGCASGGFSELREEHEELASLERLFEQPRPLPAADEMASDVELVTFRFASRSGPGERRDTIRGPEEVDRWLRQLQAQQLPAVSFTLNPNQVHRCRDGVVLSGSYPILVPGRDASQATQQYRARWHASAGGDWKLHRLWLDPGPDARVHQVGTECRSREQVLRQSRRWIARVETLGSFSPAVDQASEAILEAGWTYDGHPKTEEGTAGFSVGLGYRLTRMFSLQALAVRHPEMTAKGRATTVARAPTLRVARSMVGLVALADLGMFQFGGGPLVAKVDTDWTEGWKMWEPESASETTHGGLVQASFLLPSFARGRPYIGARYMVLAGTEIPAYRTSDSFSMSIRAFDITAGVELVF